MFVKLENCLACGNDHLIPVLDLNDQPLANTYPTHANEDEPHYPLAVNRCRDCYHLQLTHTVNPEIIYKNYLEQYDIKLIIWIFLLQKHVIQIIILLLT